MVEIRSIRPLWFDDGSPVRAASAIARFGDGWLIAQDDATHGAWCRGESVRPVRLVPPVEGLDVFSEADGTKHLKPDLEAACELPDDDGVVLLGSGSSPARMRGVVARLDDDAPRVTVGDLSSVYAAVAAALDIELAHLNLEGICDVGTSLRWFHRGNRFAGIPDASVDVPAAALVAAVEGTGPIDAVGPGAVRRYDLGHAEGVGLAVTDAIALPDGRVIVCAAAEDTPNAIDDGPVVATALALLDDDAVIGVWPIPETAQGPHKVEGLALLAVEGDHVELLAVEDADDPATPSNQLELRLRLPPPGSLSAGDRG